LIRSAERAEVERERERKRRDVSARKRRRERHRLERRENAPINFLLYHSPPLSFPSLVRCFTFARLGDDAAREDHHREGRRTKKNKAQTGLRSSCLQRESREREREQRLRERVTGGREELKKSSEAFFSLSQQWRPQRSRSPCRALRAASRRRRAAGGVSLLLRALLLSRVPLVSAASRPPPPGDDEQGATTYSTSSSPLEMAKPTRLPRPRPPPMALLR